MRAIPFDTTQITSPANYSAPKQGDPCHPIAAGAHAPAVAYGIDEEQNAARELFGTLKARQAGGGFEGAVAVDCYNQTLSNVAIPIRSKASDIDHTGGVLVPTDAVQVQWASGGATGKPNSTGFAVWSRAQLPILATSNGRPSPNSQGVRAVAGISRQPHAHPLAWQTRRAMPGWAALQGAGQQHGRSLHGVDRIAHSRAAVGAFALSLGMQRDRSRKHGVGAARVAARRLCRGGEVSKCRVGASLAASAEHGGHEQP